MSQAKPGGQLSADIAIIGGGSAGALLAARLSEDPARRILLIEAGEEATDPDIWNPAAWPALQGRSYDWDYRTEPQAGTAGRISSLGTRTGGWAVRAASMPWATCGGILKTSTPGPRRPATRAGAGTVCCPPSRPTRITRSRDATAGPLPIHRTDAEASPLTNAFIAAGAALGLPRLQGHNEGVMIGVTPNAMNIRDGKRVTVADAWLTPGGPRPREPDDCHRGAGPTPGVGAEQDSACRDHPPRRPDAEFPPTPCSCARARSKRLLC